MEGFTNCDLRWRKVSKSDDHLAAVQQFAIAFRKEISDQLPAQNLTRRDLQRIDQLCDYLLSEVSVSLVEDLPPQVYVRVCTSTFERLLSTHQGFPRTQLQGGRDLDRLDAIEIQNTRARIMFGQPRGRPTFH
jgi:hypothetical protein